MVYCWKLSKTPTSSVSLVWWYQPPATMTCMGQIGSNIALLGSNQGHLCLVDWTTYTKEWSFSNGNRPLVLQRLIPHHRLDAPRCDKRLQSRMGIVQLRVDTTKTGCKVGKKHWG
jgi:hypothetical protein